MKFSQSFLRYLPGGPLQPALGSDTAPTNATFLTVDNTGRLRYCYDSEEAKSMIVGFIGPAGTPAVPIEVWFWDELGLNWYLCDTLPITSGTVIWLDCALIQPHIPDITPDLFAGYFYIRPVPTPLVVYPVGTYTFSFGLDVSDPDSDIEWILLDIAAHVANIDANIELLTKFEDDPHVSGDAGIQALAVRNDNAAVTFTTNNGDYSPIGVNPRGVQFVTPDPQIGVGFPVPFFPIGPGADLNVEDTCTAVEVTKSVPIATQECDSVLVKVSCGAPGWGTGVVYFEGLLPDQTTWQAVTAYALNPPVRTGITQTTADGAWYIPCAQYRQIRCRAATVNSGTVTMSLESGMGKQTSTEVAGVYYEDTLHVSGDFGREILGVRNDGAATALTGADGRYSPIGTNLHGSVWIGMDPSVEPMFARTNGYEFPAITVDGIAVYDTSPAHPPFTHSTEFVDGTLTRVTDITANFVATTGVAVPTTAQIVSVIVDTGTAKRILINGRNGCYISIAAGVVTVAGAGAAPMPAGSLLVLRWNAPGARTGYAEDSPHYSGDVGTEILAVRRDVPVSSSGSDGDYSNVNTDANGCVWIKDFAYDAASNSNRELPVTDITENRTTGDSPVPVISSAYTLTGAFNNVGIAIPAMGYTRVMLWFDLTINGSTDLRIKACPMHTSGGNLYQFPMFKPDTTVPGAYKILFEPEYFELGIDTSGRYTLTWDVSNCVQYIQFQFMVGAVGAPAGTIDAAYVTYGWAS